MRVALPSAELVSKAINQAGDNGNKYTDTFVHYKRLWENLMDYIYMYVCTSVYEENKKFGN